MKQITLRLFSLLIILCTLVCFAGCSSSSVEAAQKQTKPEHPVTLFFDAAKRCDFDKMHEVAIFKEYYADTDLREAVGNDWFLEGLKLVNPNLTFTVLGTELRSDDAALVTVSVSYQDWSMEMLDAIMAYVDEMQRDYLANTPKSEEEYSRHVSELFVKSINENKDKECKTSTLELQCFKEKDGKWKLLFTENLYYPITAECLSAYAGYKNQIDMEQQELQGIS